MYIRPNKYMVRDKRRRIGHVPSNGDDKWRADVNNGRRLRSGSSQLGLREIQYPIRKRRYCAAPSFSRMCITMVLESIPQYIDA